MAATQLSFTLRTTATVQSVHLIGSWDGYQGQLPLSRDPSKSAGGWVGTFRFQTTVLQPGQRYWYYYIMDGYHVSHDPAREHTVEPTTGRKLNILDVPKSKSSKSSTSKRQSRRYSREVPQGRSLSPSQIKSPKPSRPDETVHVRSGYSQAMLDQLSQQFAQVTVEESDSDSDSDSGSDVPSLSSGSSRSSCSSPSSVSSNSSVCTCERYGITRAGHRVKLDCGGDRCGHSGSESCSSESEEEYAPRHRYARRHGVVVRG